MKPIRQIILENITHFDCRINARAQDAVDAVLTEIALEGYVIVPINVSDEALLAVGTPYGGRAGSYAAGLQLRREAWVAILTAITNGK